MRTRIVFFDHTSLMSGGEIALGNLIETVDQERFKPILVLCSDGPFAEHMRARNVETHVLKLSDAVLKTRKDALGVQSLSQLIKVASIIKYIAQLSALFKRLNADLIHTNSLKSDILGALAGRLAGLPVIWHVRDRIAPDYLPGKVVTLFRALSLVLPTHVVAISEATRVTLPQPNNSVHYSIVHDGVVPQAFSQTVRPWNSQDIVRIGIVGRISPWKGQHVFIEAASQLHASYPNAIFEIIGSAMFDEKDYEKKLLEMVASLDLSDTIFFRGYRSDIFTALQELDIVVHASTIGEPFGQVIVEGMAAAKPVIATKGGASAEIIRDGIDGMLVEPSDAEALAQALAGLLGDPVKARSIGLQGQERVRSNFGIDKTARGMEKIFSQIAARRKN